MLLFVVVGEKGIIIRKKRVSSLKFQNWSTASWWNNKKVLMAKPNGLSFPFYREKTLTYHGLIWNYHGLSKTSFSPSFQISIFYCPLPFLSVSFLFFLVNEFSDLFFFNYNYITLKILRPSKKSHLYIFLY